MTIKNSIIGAYKSLDVIDDLNFGGCGIAALAVIAWAKKRFPKKSLTIAYIYTIGLVKFARTNQEILMDGDYENLWVPYHIALFVDGDFIDSGGIIENTERYAEIVKSRSVNDLIMFLEYGEWNSDFDRTSGIRKINKILGINLKKFGI